MMLLFSTRNFAVWYVPVEKTWNKALRGGIVVDHTRFGPSWPGQALHKQRRW